MRRDEDRRHAVINQTRARKRFLVSGLNLRSLGSLIVSRPAPRAGAHGDGLDEIDQNYVGLARLGQEAWRVVSEIGGIELRIVVDLAGEEPGDERAKRHKA